MNKETLKNLGWKHSGTWNNREIYSLGGFKIVEHNGYWFIAKSDDLYYIELPDLDILTEQIITEFTSIAKAITNNIKNEDSCTLAEWRRNVEKLGAFYKKYSDEEIDEEDE